MCIQKEPITRAYNYFLYKFQKYIINKNPEIQEPHP